MMELNHFQVLDSLANPELFECIWRASLVLAVLGFLVSGAAGCARSNENSVARAPILYTDADARELVIRSVYADGSPAGTPVHGQLAGWSPRGDRFAYLTKDNGSVNLVAMGGQPETIFKPGPGETIYLSGWQSIWRPDGKRIALLLARVESAKSRTFTLAIVDIEKKKVVNRFELPESAYTRNGMSMNWPPYNLKWSPDGSKILLAWEQTLILDVDKTVAEIVTPNPAMAEWAANSSVYYFDRLFSVGSLCIKEIGQKKEAKVLDRSQLSSWGMIRTVAVHAPILKLYPDGTRLAMTAGSGQGIKSTVLVFNIDPTRPGVLKKPAESVGVEAAVLGMEWGPDKKTLALLVVSEENLTIRLLNLETGTVKILTRLTGVDPQSDAIDLVGLVNMISWAP